MLSESAYTPYLFGRNTCGFGVMFYNNHTHLVQSSSKSGHLISSLIYKALVQIFGQFPLGFESDKNNMWTIVTSLIDPKL